MRLTATSLALLMLATVPGQAGFIVGNKLHEACQNTARGNIVDGQFIYGYAAGAFDSLQAEKSNNNVFCLPEQVTLPQVRDIMCGYIARHPENRQWTASILMLLALREAWPCQKQAQ